MIKENEPISMTEAQDYISKSDKGNEIKGFIKKFVKLKPKKAEELRKKLEELDMLKLKQSHVAKIIDLLPEDKENLNKIFTDISLTDEETKQILEIVKEYI